MSAAASHAHAVSRFPASLVESIYQDLRKRNLRNYQDNETRWLAERLSAVAARRKALKKNPDA